TRTAGRGWSASDKARSFPPLKLDHVVAELFDIHLPVVLTQQRSGLARNGQRRVGAEERPRNPVHPQIRGRAPGEKTGRVGLWVEDELPWLINRRAGHREGLAAFHQFLLLTVGQYLLGDPAHHLNMVPAFP